MQQTTKKMTGAIIIAWLSMILYQLLFGISGVVNSMMITPTLSKKWLFFSFVKFVLFAGQSLFPMVIGFFAMQDGKKLTKVVRTWLGTIITGILILFGWMFFDKWSSSSALWRVLFPFTHNSYPLLAGALVGFCIVIVAKKWLLENAQKVWLGLIFIVSAPTIFNQDIFTVQSDYSVVNPIIFVLLGALVSQLPATGKLQRFSAWWASVAAVLAGVSLFGMIPLSAFSNRGLATVNRFVLSSSVLTYILSVSLFALLLNFHFGKNQRRTVSTGGISAFIAAFVFLGNTDSNSFLHSFLKAHLANLNRGNLLLFMAIFALIIAGSVLLSMFVEILFKIPVMTNLVHWFSNFFEALATENLQEMYQSFLQRLKKHRVFLMTFVWFYVVSAVSILSMNQSLTISPTSALKVNIYMYTLLFRQPIIILNVLFIGAFFYLWLIITKRYWLSFNLTNVFVAIIIIANVLKLTTRNEPILPADLAEITAVGSLLKMVGSQVVFGAAIGIVLVVVVTLLLRKYLPVPIKMNVRHRLIALVIIAVTFISPLFWNHDHFIVEGLVNMMDDQRMFYNQELGAQMNGPIIQFLNNLDVSVMAKPSDYSKAEVQRVVDKYTKEARSINADRTGKIQDQTFIMNLSESFSNPNRVPGLTVTPNPLPYITSLKKQTTSGLMLSSGYGGGTANMEYQALTGMAISNFSPTLPTPYTQLVTNLDKAPALTDQFDYSAAIHPYYGVYYNRVSVYEKFGFNKFSYLGSKYPIKHQHKIGTSSYMSDETAYENALDQINDRKGGQFINLVTMQNHYPFKTDVYPKHEFTASGSAYADEETKQSIENYSQGLNYTDIAVKHFKEQIDKINKPIIWVWYGDHLAGLYNGDSMAKDGLALHQTDYFVYANKYSRQHGYKATKSKIVGPNNFSALAMEQAGVKVTPYYALMTRIQEDLPAMTITTSSDTTNTLNGGTEFVNEKGKIIPEKNLSKKQKQILHDYRIIQYDIVAGKQYSQHEPFMK